MSQVEVHRTPPVSLNSMLALVGAGGGDPTETSKQSHNIHCIYTASTGKHFGRRAIGSTQNIKAFGYQCSTDTSNTPAREKILTIQEQGQCQA